MANSTYTFIVVPHAKARFRKFQISVRFAKWALIASSAGVILLTGILVHYARIATEVRGLRQLRSENAQLRTKTQEYEQNAGRLQAQLASLQKMVTKLGVMAGMEQTLPDSSIGGVGGVTGQETVAPSAELGLSLKTMETTRASRTSIRGSTSRRRSAPASRLRPTVSWSRATRIPAPMATRSSSTMATAS
jgi:hypothetical protein